MADQMSMQSFGEEHFGGVALGHKTRNACLVKVANLMQRHPGGSLPNKLGSPKHYKAFDRLVNRPEVTHAAVIEPHRQRTFRLMEQVEGPAVLLVHDGTVLDYSHLLSLAEELGPVGDGRGRGYLCHQTLAIDPQRRMVLGLAHQILHHCDRVAKGESVAAKRLREGRESRLWTRAVRAIGTVAPGKRVVDVCDRGADLFEFLAWEVKHRRSFVVRSTHNRALTGEDAETTTGYLHDMARTQPELGRKKITVPGRGGDKDRKTNVAVSATQVTIKPPHVRRGEYDKVPLVVTVLRVWEPNPPPGVDPIEWLLLTDRPVSTAAEAWQCVSWYECRWMIEELHKAQKTGCGIEEVQFASVEALEPTIALLSVVATTLLQLRSLSRQPEAAMLPATTVVDKPYVEVLSRWRHRRSRLLTVAEFFMALARLGGHQNRKGDGQPGWLVLWRGWMKLQLMQTGYEIRGQR